MRILIASFTFPPQVGGVAEVTRTQAASFAARGHQVEVVTTVDARRTGQHAPEGVTVRQFDISGTFLAGHGYRGEIAAYQDFIVNAKADVVLFHCWQNWAVDVAIPVLKHSLACKIILSHGFDAQVWKPQPALPWGLGVWLKALPYLLKLPRSMRAFDQLIFLSERSDWGRFLDVGVAQRTCSDRVSIIPNGVHLRKFEKSGFDFRKEFGIATKFLMLNVANYDDRKNQIATVRDFMAANREDVTLVCIGGEFNEYHAKLAGIHTELQRLFPRAKVRFLEKVPKNVIYAAYQAADVFILGAKYETQPLAILDAMAARLPFISTDTGCVSEFPGGLVCPAGQATIAAVQRLLDDDELRRRLGEEGRVACESKYDWVRVMDAYEKLLARLVAQR